MRIIVFISVLAILISVATLILVISKSTRPSPGQKHGRDDEGRS